MTRDHDIERVLERWFTEGPTQMPNRFLDDTLDRIDRAPQHRLARLQTRLLAMFPNLRFAATAAIIVATVLIGAAVLTRTGDNSGSPAGPTLLPASLQLEWQSVGTRVVPGPGPGGINTYSLGILIDPASIDIQNAHTDVVNSARLVAPDRFEIRAITMGDFWHCAVGDPGAYLFSLTAGDRQLTLTPVTDACTERAAVLAGDWSRTDLGVLQPGRREAAIFRPFGGATTGRLAYAVSTGWTGADMQDGLFALGRPSLSDQAVIRVISNANPSAQDAPCSENRAAAGVGRTPAEMAAWLRTLPGLIVSTSTGATVGGLDGIMVDLSLAPASTTTCTAGAYTFSYGGSSEGGWSSRLALKSGLARYVLLDLGDGSTLVIAIEAPAAEWNAFIADAMPVIDSFEFTR